MNTKEHLKALCNSNIDLIEDVINKNLNNEKLLTQGELNIKIVDALKCDPDLSRILAKLYIEMREDIEAIRGPRGGIRRVLPKIETPITQPSEKKVEIVAESKVETVQPSAPKVEIKLSEDIKDVPYNQTAQAHIKAKEDREQREKEQGIEHKTILTSEIS